MSSKPKSRLGRGLSSLMAMTEIEPVSTGVAAPTPAATSVSADVDLAAGPTTPQATSTDPVPPGSQVVAVPLEQIVPNPHQPRRQMDETAIAELAASIRSTGLIQPIVVRKSREGYELIAGERRWRAAKMAGLAAIPVLVREVNSIEQAQMALVENIQRENLNPIDRALAYRTLMSQLGLTQAELASRTGEDRSSVANYLRLLDLAAPVQAMVVDGRLSLGHAKILAGLPDPAEQERLANLVVNQSLSVRNLERTLESAPAVVTREVKETDPHYKDLERSISQQLGLRVQVRGAAKKGRGKLIFHYASLEQFDDLIERLGVKVEP